MEQWLADNTPLRCVLRLAGPLGAILSTENQGYMVRLVETSLKNQPEEKPISSNSCKLPKKG